MGRVGSLGVGPYKYTRPSLLKSYIHYITYSVLGNAEEFYGTLCRQMIKLGFEDINLSYRVVCIYCKRGVLVMWVACKVLLPMSPILWSSEVD